MRKLYNPLSEDFRTTYDIHEDAVPLPYVIHAHEIEMFEEAVALHIEQKLAHEVTCKRGWQGSNYEDRKKEVLKEIQVDEVVS